MVGSGPGPMPHIMKGQGRGPCLTLHPGGYPEGPSYMGGGVWGMHASRYTHGAMDIVGGMKSFIRVRNGFGMKVGLMSTLM